MIQQLNISLPPSKNSNDFDAWMIQTAQYLRDYLGPANGVIYSAASTGNADNYSILSSELNSISSSGGIVILFPSSSNYKFSTKLNIPLNTFLVGMIRGSSKLEYTGNGIAIEFDYGTDVPVQFNSGLKNIQLIGTNRTGTGVKITDAYFIDLEDCIITNFETGLKSHSESASFAGYVNLERCYIHANARNVDLSGSENNIWNFNGGRIFLSATYEGILIQGGYNTGISFNGTGFESNVVSNVKFAGSSFGINFNGCYFETAYETTDGIQFTGAYEYSGINVIGNYFFQNHAAATGSAIVFTSTAELIGIRIKGNYNAGYGKISGGGTGSFINFGSKVFKDSDFTDNSFASSVGQRYLNMPSASSNSCLVHKITKIEQIDFGSVNANDSTESTVTGVVADAFVRSAVHVTPLRLDGGAGCAALEGGLIVTGYVDSESNVKIRLTNATVGNINPISRDYLIEVFIY